jgi:hypothetical protein
MNEAVYKEAAALVAKGIPVIPVWGVNLDGSCTCPRGKECAAIGKHPVSSSWQTSPITDESDLDRHFADVDSPRNVGILLGPTGGVIDVEHDCERGEATAERLGLPRSGTASFRSSRSRHYLFKFSQGLPSKAVLPDVEGLEVRIGNAGRGAQSVAPASTHKSGAVYSWVPGCSIHECDILPAPQILLDLISSVASSGESNATDLTVVEEPVTAGGRHDAVRRLTCRLAMLLGDREASSVEQNTVYAAASAINQTRCKPPLEDAEVRQLVASSFTAVRKYREENQTLSNVEVENKFSSRWQEVDAGGDMAVVTRSDFENTLVSTGLRLTDEGWKPGRWTMTIYNGTPKVYQLNIPYVTNESGRVEEKVAAIELASADFQRPDVVAAAIMEGATKLDVNPMPGSFAKIWLGSPPKKNDPGVTGLKTLLLNAADVREPDIGDVSYASFARSFLQALQAAVGEPLEHPDREGLPVSVDGVGIVFKWTAVVDVVLGSGSGNYSKEDSRAFKKAIRNRLGEDVMRNIKISPTGDAKRLRYQYFTEAAFEQLENFVDSL